MSARVTLETLTLQHLRALVLLGQGYSSEEVAARVGLAPPTLRSMTRRLCDQVCVPDQRDGREPLAIVRVWSTQNLPALRERVRLASVPLSQLAPVVTEARLGVA